MPQTAVITGGGTGLGQALAKQLAAYGLKVYIVGRRVHKLQQTQAFYPSRITTIVADVSTPGGRKKIINTLKRGRIDYLVHNAAIVTPINPLKKFSLQQWRKIQAINVEGPLFLTKALLPRLKTNARILHISSDCASYPLAHWIPYCTAKAALHMIYQCLKKELATTSIIIGSLDPGMMDTPMQRYICSDHTTFPEKYTRKELQQKKLLFSADYSAKHCLKMLLELSPRQFSLKEYHVT